MTSQHSFEDGYSLFDILDRELIPLDIVGSESHEASVTMRIIRIAMFPTSSQLLTSLAIAIAPLVRRDT